MPTRGEAPCLPGRLVDQGLFSITGLSSCKLLPAGAVASRIVGELQVGTHACLGVPVHPYGFQHPPFIVPVSPTPLPHPTPTPHQRCDSVYRFALSAGNYFVFGIPGPQRQAPPPPHSMVGVRGLGPAQWQLVWLTEPASSDPMGIRLMGFSDSHAGSVLQDPRDRHHLFKDT